MIEYKDALERARAHKNDINECTEFENGWVFSNTADADYIGGGHTPVVILKAGGRAVTMPYFVVHGTGEELKTFEVK